MSEATRSEDGPYVGLVPFDAAHADYFFGRTVDSAVLVDNVLARTIVVLYGASGVGKSSLLNVGLPRALAAQGASARIVLRREWHEPASVDPWLDGVIGAALVGPRQPILLVLDQFEEYFLYATSGQLEAFARSLAALVARSDIEVHLLLALRDDGLHRLDAMRQHLPRVLDTTLELRHLSEGAVHEAITEPIGVWNRHHPPGVALEGDFADSLIAQLRPKDQDGQPVKGGRVELAYLQLALERIWDAEGGMNTTALRTSTLIEKLKGVGEISRRHVEEVLGTLTEDDQALCATVFDRLVTPSGGKILYATSDLATVARVDTKRIEEVLAPLASGKSRLLRTVELPGGQHLRGYEILHDILARPILAWREHRVAKLERARADVEAEARLKAERDRARIAKMSRALVALVFLLLVVAGFAWQAARNADRQTAIAEASSLRANGLRLAAESQAILTGQRSGGDERAFLQLIAADRIAPSPEALGGLLNALLSTYQLNRLVGTGTAARTVAFSPDGRRIVSGSDDKTLRQWDATTGETIGAPLEGHKDYVRSVAFSPDGRRIVSGGWDGTLRLWDAATGQPIGAPLEGHKGYVESVAFSPDGRRIVSGSWDKTLRLWDATTGQPIGAPLEGHKGYVESVAFSPDGRRIVSGSGDNTLRLWDATTGQPIGAPLEGHKDSVRSVAFSPDGRRIVSGSEDRTLRQWDATTGRPIGAPLEGHQKFVSSVAFSPDGRRIVSGSGDNTLRLWDATTGQPIGAPLEGHQKFVSSVAFSPDGRRIVSGSGDNTLRLWDATTSQPIGAPPEGHKNNVTSVAFSPDGRRIVSGSDDKTLRQWNATTGQPIGAPLEGHKASVMSVAFSPDGRRIVSGSWDRTLRLWDAATGQPIGAPLEGHKSIVGSVAFSPDGRRIVSGSWDNTLRLWDATTGQPIGAPLEGHKGYVDSTAFSPDGRRIVSGSGDNTLRLWDATTGQPIGAPLEGHKDHVGSVAFSPDGRRIVSGSGDRTLRLWDATTGQPIGAPLEGHKSNVSSVAFSPDGRRIVSGSFDDTLRLWDATTGRPIGAPLEGHQKFVSSVAFSPDGRRIVSGSWDKTLRLWPAPAAWADELCAKLTRNMSPSEWRAWVSPDIAYAKQCPELPIPVEAPVGASQSSGKR